MVYAAVWEKVYWSMSGRVTNYSANTPLVEETPSADGPKGGVWTLHCGLWSPCNGPRPPVKASTNLPRIPESWAGRYASFAMSTESAAGLISLRENGRIRERENEP